MAQKNPATTFDHDYWKDRIDLSRWGSECRRGLDYKTIGAPVRGGTHGVVRKIGAGRKKYRGMASDSFMED